MILEYEVNAYETNQVSLYAVQGEKDSRTITFSIIEESGIQIPTSNAVVINKMLDLTDYTPTLYVIRPDDLIVSCEGTITDAENGIVTFVLSEECTELSGTAECAIVLTKDNTNLRVVGISLKIAACNIDGDSSDSKGDHATTEYLSVFDATEIEVYTEDYEVESE